jgi:hypothetical protein
MIYCHWMNVYLAFLCQSNTCSANSFKYEYFISLHSLLVFYLRTIYYLWCCTLLILHKVLNPCSKTNILISMHISHFSQKIVLCDTTSQRINALYHIFWHVSLTNIQTKSQYGQYKDGSCCSFFLTNWPHFQNR